MGSTEIENSRSYQVWILFKKARCHFDLRSLERFTSPHSIACFETELGIVADPVLPSSDARAAAWVKVLRNVEIVGIICLRFTVLLPIHWICA